MVFRKFFRPSVDPFNVLKSQPNRLLISPKTQNNFGWSRAKLGFYAEAVPAFEYALRLR